MDAPGGTRRMGDDSGRRCAGRKLGRGAAGKIRGLQRLGTGTFGNEDLSANVGHRGLHGLVAEMTDGTVLR